MRALLALVVVVRVAADQAPAESAVRAHPQLHSLTEFRHAIFSMQSQRFQSPAVFRYLAVRKFDRLKCAVAVGTECCNSD
jgi:hypothetical protein